MPHDDKHAKLIRLSMFIVVFYIIFAFLVAGHFLTYIPQMEEAGEETAELLSRNPDAGGAVQIIHHNMASEVKTAYIISLISFGVLDGAFILMLWRRRVKRGLEDVSITVTGIQVCNRFVSAFIIVQLSISVFVAPNPRTLMNIIYLTIIISSLASLALIFIVYTKLTEIKTKEIAFKVQEEAVG